MRVTAKQIEDVVRIAKKDKILHYKPELVSAIYFANEKGLIKEVNTGQYMVTQNGKDYLEALDFKKPTKHPKIQRRFKIIYNTLSDITIGEWSVIVGIISIIVAIIIDILNRKP